MQTKTKSSKNAAKNYICLRRGDVKNLAKATGVSGIYATQVLSGRRPVGKSGTKSYKIHQAAIALAKSRLDAIKGQLKQNYEHLAGVQ